MKHERQQASKHDNIINILKKVLLQHLFPGKFGLHILQKIGLIKKKKKRKKQKQNTRFRNNDYSITTNHIDWKKKDKICTFFIAFPRRLSPTGIRTPPKIASTAPMMAPVRSPQFLLQPIPFLCQGADRQCKNILAVRLDVFFSLLDLNRLTDVPERSC